MSDFKQLEEKYDEEKNSLLKEKIRLKDELDQIKNEKIYYKQKADLLSFNKVADKEHEIKNDLQLVESDLIAVKNKIDQLQKEKANLERKRKQKEKQKQIKKQMNEVLKYIRQGKNRSEAAELVGIKESKILNWYNEGKLGTNDNTRYFYRELSKTEKEQKEKTKKERLNKQKQENIEKQIKQNAINDLMYEVLQQMQNGKTRQQAAQIAGVKFSQVNDWYEKGLNNETKYFYHFYKKVNEIESLQKNSLNINESNLNSEINNTGLTIVNVNSEITTQKSNPLVAVNYCQNCGKKLNGDESTYCTNCGSSLIEIKKSYSNRSDSAYRSKTAPNTNSFGKCCSGLMVLFVIIAILILII